jgi:predicted nucleotidyltransferase
VKIEAIVGLLQQRLPDLLAVYAFGSRAQGAAGPDSDLDLAVLTPKKRDQVTPRQASGSPPTTPDKTPLS